MPPLDGMSPLDGDPTIRADTAEAAGADDPTITMPPVTETPKRWRTAGVVGVVVALGCGVAAGALLANDGSDLSAPSRLAAPGSTSTPGAVPSAPPDATAPPTAPRSAWGPIRGAETLGTLLVALASDPRAFGTRGPELRARIARLVDADVVSAEDRDALLRDVAEWIQDGELDPAVGAAVGRLVASLPVVASDDVDDTDDDNGDGDDRGAGDDRDGDERGAGDGGDHRAGG